MARQVSEKELLNTVEAYTFLAHHLLEKFPSSIWHWRPRRILWHAMEHLTGEKSPSRLRRIVLAAFG